MHATDPDLPDEITVNEAREAARLLRDLGHGPRQHIHRDRDCFFRKMRRARVSENGGGSTMRRTALLIALMAIVVAIPGESFDLNLAVGADFGGDFDLGDFSLSSNTGYNLGLELAFDVSLIDLGVGLEYGFSRGASSYDLDASYYQIYGIGRFFFGPLYLAGRIGYADMSVSTILEGDFGGGSSWGLGGGIELFGKLKAELLFNNINTDLGYQSWTIRLLYTF